jgi:hypothetical protein
MVDHIGAAVATTYRVTQNGAEGSTYFRDRCLQPLGHPSKYYGARKLGGSLPTPQPVSAPPFLGRPLIPRRPLRDERAPFKEREILDVQLPRSANGG